MQGSSSEEVFRPVIHADTAAPVRRTVHFTASGAGDVLVKVCEGESDIKVTKPEPKGKAQTNGEKDEDDEDDDDDDEDYEDEEVRERIWKVGKTLAELAVKDVKKGDKVELMVNVNPDLSLQATARVVGSKTGVRGNLEAPKTEANGSA